MSGTKRRPSDYLNDWLASAAVEALDTYGIAACYAIGAHLDNVSGIAYPGEEVVVFRMRASRAQYYEALSSICGERGPFERGSVRVGRGGKPEVGTFVLGGKGGNGRRSAFRLKPSVSRVHDMDATQEVGSIEGRSRVHGETGSRPSIKGKCLRTTSNYYGGDDDENPALMPVIKGLADNTDAVREADAILARMNAQSPSGPEYIGKFDALIYRRNADFKAKRKRRKERPSEDEPADGASSTALGSGCYATPTKSRKITSKLRIEGTTAGPRGQ